MTYYITSRLNPKTSPSVWQLFDAIDKDFFSHNLFRGLDFPELSNQLKNNLTHQPQVDIFEKDNQYILKANVAGYKPENIEVSYDQEKLTIKGNIKEEKENQTSEKVLHKEWHQTEFERQFKLKDIESSRIKAEFKDGILTIEAPKSSLKQVIQIPIEKVK